MAKSDANIDASLAALAAITVPNVTRRFNELERDVIDLYEELGSLKLEQGVVRAENDSDLGDMGQSLTAAQGELLNARARFGIKQSVVGNVLQSDPIIDAAAPTTEQPRSALELSINHRDVLAIVQTNLAADLTRVLDDLTTKQAENIRVVNRNRGLASRLLELANEARDDRVDNLGDSELATELETAQNEEREQRRRYRIIKGLMGGVIVGSGVNWAKDDHLREFVLDAED